MSPVKFIFPVLIFILAACQPHITPAAAGAGASLPNPASIFCEENGGRLEIREDASGGQYGMCLFPDSSECDEWAYFRGECTPAGTPHPQTPVATSATLATEEQPAGAWLLYQDEMMDYRFEYPPDLMIEQGADAPGSLAIHGVSPDNEFWPQIMVNHPASREDFQPPEDVNLEDWLVNHNLLPDERQPDASIAGTTAVHLRHERSPQSYAFDRYYFAHAGQLYEVVIVHVGDHEDWELYNRFLESFEFIK